MTMSLQKPQRTRTASTAAISKMAAQGVPYFLLVLLRNLGMSSSLDSTWDGRAPAARKAMNRAKFPANIAAKNT